MARTPLIPPRDAPPDSWRRGKGKLNLRLALLGALIGGVVGGIALFLNASPWWWVSVPVGLSLGSVTSQSFKVPMSWARK